MTSRTERLLALLRQIVSELRLLREDYHDLRRRVAALEARRP